MLLTINSYCPTSITWSVFITKAVVRQELNWYGAQPRVRKRASSCEIWGGQNSTGAGFFAAYFGFPVSVTYYQAFPRQEHFTYAPHSKSFHGTFIRRTSGRKLGTLARNVSSRCFPPSPPRLSEVIWYVIYSRTSDYTDFSSFQHSFCVRQHAYLNHTRIHKQNGQKKVQKWLKDTCPVSNTEPTLATAHRLERNGNSNNRDSENRHCTVHSSKDQKMQILCFLSYITWRPVARWTRSDVSVKRVLSNIYDATSHKISKLNPASC
jgi:hypothetical protein